MKILLGLLITVLSFSTYANQIDIGPCIAIVRADAGYDNVKAAQACKGGITIACIDLLRRDSGYDNYKAAKACGGKL